MRFPTFLAHIGYCACVAVAGYSRARVVQSVQSVQSLQSRADVLFTVLSPLTGHHPNSTANLQVLLHQTVITNLLPSYIFHTQYAVDMILEIKN